MNAVHPLPDPWARAPVLRAHLEPIWSYLNEDSVSEIAINRPGELFIERLGAKEMEHVVKREVTPGWIRNISTGVASATNQVINEEKPVLSAALPSGERIQCILPPAAPEGGAISIRKQVIMDMSLDAYKDLGAFENTAMGSGLALSSEEKRLVEMLHDTSPMDFLQYAVRNRVSIVVSGGTSTGKTTFLNALVREIPGDERLILIEDTPEIVVGQANSVGLVSVRGELGEARVTTNDLVSAALRMRPDRIILGELRGPEAFAFLRAVRSGHPGSMTTIHADSSEAAVEQLVMLVLQTGTKLSRRDVRHYVERSIDIYVHLARSGGRRMVETVALANARESQSAECPGSAK